MIAWLLALTLLPQPGARISGVVISDDGSRKPVRHALVSLSGPSNSEMITGDDGTFTFPDLVPGHYTVFAGKPGFAHTIYGTRPGRDIGTPIAVAAGQQIASLQLKLARGAVITGTLTGLGGEPVPNVTVSAWQLESGETRRRPLLVEGGSAVSDEEGVFRIFGLAEGEFFIQAQPSSTTTDVSPYAPTYYPSTARIGESPRISVHAGEERSGADIVLRTSQRANVSGVVVDADGRPASGLEVTLDPTGTGADALSQDDAIGTRTGADGLFTFSGVLSGTYTLLATEQISAMTATSSATPRHWASMDLSVDARDVAGISLTLRPATPVSGRVVFDGTASIGATSLAFIAAAGPGGRAQPKEDGMWSTAGLIPGQYSL
ncbi:MAG: carboxypeptidase-like regulatory domain-containing protein, partial [Acidobacteriota bacterium]